MKTRNIVILTLLAISLLGVCVVSIIDYQNKNQVNTASIEYTPDYYATLIKDRWQRKAPIIAQDIGVDSIKFDTLIYINSEVEPYSGYFEAYIYNDTTVTKQLLTVTNIKSKLTKDILTLTFDVNTDKLYNKN